MKILITTDLYTTATNGVVTSVKNLYNELVEKGHDVKILTFSEKAKSYKKDNVYYVRSMSLEVVYPNVRMPLSYRHKYLREIIEWDPDVIHSQCEFFSMEYACRIAKKTGAPIVHTYHTMYEQYVGYVVPGKKLGNWVVKYLTQLRLKKVDLVVVPTTKIENLLHSYPVDKPMEIVPSGISLEQHKNRMSEQERARKRADLGIFDAQSVLLNLGRLGTEKNLPELVRFFKDAHDKHAELVFLIVGDGPAKTELEKLAKELGVEDSVIFTGMVDPSEVQKYYQLGDIFVSASTSETQGLTYIEAAANGLPLLCRQDPCLDDVLKQGENGYAYNTEQEFLGALDTILADREWQKNASIRSEQLASVFDRKHFGDAIEAIYNNIK